MAELVKDGAIPIDLVGRKLLEWHRDEVGARGIIGTVPADADVGVRGVDQRLGMRQSLALGQRFGDPCQTFGQALALVDVEDGEALKEGGLPRR